MDWKILRAWIGGLFSGAAICFIGITFAQTGPPIWTALALSFWSGVAGLCLANWDNFRLFVRRWTAVQYKSPFDRQ